MEFLFIVVLIVFGVALRPLRLFRPKRKTYRPRPRPVVRFVTPAYKSKFSPKPFDDATARELETPKSLEGRAFVVDGDTLVIRKTQIRLFGVDAPEIDHPYGQKAKWELVSLCKGQIVRAEISAVDRHGRSVARCFLPDGRDLSAEMVKAGLAIDWFKYSKGEYRKLEVPNARKKMWLADARQNGRMHVWERYEATNRPKASPD